MTPLDWTSKASLATRKLKSLKVPSANSSFEFCGQDKMALEHEQSQLGLWPNCRCHMEMASDEGVYQLITQTTVDELRDLLECDESLVKKTDEDLMTPLHVAVELQKMQHAQVLIEFGADVNAKSLELKVTPLHMAARIGHLRLADLLLASGADVNAKNKIYYTPLHVAIAKEDLEMARLLLFWSADGNLVTNDPRQESPLLKAATVSLPLTKLLVECGAKAGSRELHVAILANKVDVALFLLNHLEQGTQLKPNRIGRSHLQSVASHITGCDAADAVALARALVLRGEDVNYSNQFGSVFHILVTRGADAVSVALMDYFLSIPNRNCDQSADGLPSPLLLALKLGQVELAVKLVKEGFADVTGVRLEQTKACPQLEHLLAGLVAAEGQVLSLQGQVCVFAIYFLSSLNPHTFSLSLFSFARYAWL